jgi:hypothetical protein
MLYIAYYISVISLFIALLYLSPLQLLVKTSIVGLDSVIQTMPTFYVYSNQTSRQRDIVCKTSQ